MSLYTPEMEVEVAISMLVKDSANARGGRICVLQIIWLPYEAMDITVIDAVSFAIFVYHHVIHFGDL